MADSQHQCSIACFMIFPDLPTALSDSLRTATLCALRGRLRAMEDLDDIFFEDKVGQRGLHIAYKRVRTSFKEICSSKCLKPWLAAL